MHYTEELEGLETNQGIRSNMNLFFYFFFLNISVFFYAGQGADPGCGSSMDEGMESGSAGVVLHALWRQEWSLGIV